MKNIIIRIAFPIVFTFFFADTSHAQWSVNGNSGTNPPTNFLGTTDNKGLVFKTNAIERMRISSSGKVGIGVTSPAYKLDVGGDINMSAGNFLRIGGTQVFKDNLTTGNLLIGENTSASSAGSKNTSVGIFSLSSISTGYYNTAFGYDALHANNTGIGNTAVGFQSLTSNTSGTENVAVGDNALFTNTTGGSNVGVGSAALFAVTNGQGNTAIGSTALQSLTSGSNNTAVGTFTDVNSGTYSGSVAIGNAAMITASNQARIGNNLTLSIGGYVDWSNISDGRFKKNIRENVKGLEFINKLNPITYTLDIHGLNHFINGEEKVSAQRNDEDAISVKEKIVYSGFIAQDVENAAHEAGYDFSGVDAPKNAKDVYGLRYADFVVPLVKAVQELDEANGKLKIDLSRFSRENSEQQKQIDELKASVAQLQSSIVNRQSSVNNDYLKSAIQNPQSEISLLGQNIPNPFDNSTLIPFRIPKDCRDASIMITNTSTSEVISVLPVSCNEDHVRIDAGMLASGTYSYSLYVDGALIEAKQMVIVR